MFRFSENTTFREHPQRFTQSLVTFDHDLTKMDNDNDIGHDIKRTPSKNNPRALIASAGTAQSFQR